MMTDTSDPQPQTTPTQAETTHKLTCRADAVPAMPNASIAQTPMSVTYEIGTTLFYICQPGYESIANQSSYTTCFANGSWSLDTINMTMCQSGKSETCRTNCSETVSVIDTEQVTNDFDEHLPLLNVSNEVLSSTARPIAAGDRQLRHIVSHCNALPQIEHAQLLSDETVKHSANAEITYTGSLLFMCQVGFFSDNGDHEPFRLTCHNGAFYPKVLCIGMFTSADPSLCPFFLFPHRKTSLSASSLHGYVASVCRQLDDQCFRHLDERSHSRLVHSPELPQQDSNR